MTQVAYSLQDWRNKAAESAKTASEQVRSLALGGLAIIWAFKPVPDPSVATPTVQVVIGAIPDQLRLGAFCFIVALILDFLQYLINGIVYGIYTSRQLGKGKTASDELSVSAWIDVPHRICFGGKVLALALGMGILAITFSP